MATTAKGTPYVVSTDLVANYPTVSNDLATHIDGKLTYNAQTINAQTGTTYTFALADATLAKLVTASNAAASTYTVPPQSSVTWVDGSVLRVLNQGAGAVTLTPGASVTLDGSTLVLNQYQYAELHRTASNTWTVTGIVSTAGITLITSQTFTTASAVNINNCFSSTYANYLLMTTFTGSTGSSLNLRLRVSGADNTTTNYNSNRASLNGATISGAAVTTADNWNQVAFTGADDTNTFQAFIYRPNEATRTTFLGDGVSTSSTITNLKTAGFFTATTVFDGITMYPSAGTITGTVRVYGLRN